MDDFGHEVFTPTECRDYLGFKSVEVFGSEFQSDATMLEEMLQDRYDALGIPVHLHRHVGMGYKGFGDEPAEERIHKVFLTYSTKLLRLIRDGKVRVCQSGGAKAQIAYV